MGIGDIFDAAFRLYARHFVTFLIIALIVYLPYAVLAGVVDMFYEPLALSAQNNSDQMGLFMLATLVVLGVNLMFAIFVYPLCQGAMVHKISAEYLGESIGAAEAYRRMLPRMVTLIVASILVMLVSMAGFMFCVVPGFIALLLLMLVTATIMLENCSAVDALSRSYELMKGNLGKGFLVLLVVVLLSIIIYVVPLYTVMEIPWPSPFIGHFLGYLLEALVLPLQTAAVILFYYDLRIRKEAFDLERLAAAIGPGDTAPEPPESPQPPATPEIG